MLTRKDILVFIVGLIVYFVTALVVYNVMLDFSIFMAIGAALGILIVLSLVIYRRMHAFQIDVFHKLQQQADDNSRHTESLFSLIALLGPLKRPLPPMRRWAIAPDFATLLVSLLLEHRPRLVVELGTGTSTLVASYCLQHSEGKIKSFENDAHFAQQSRESLQEHGLADFAEVIVAPLKPTEINGTSWIWYDVSTMQNLQNIDMLIVDGPELDIRGHHRYPALPVLLSALSENAVVIVDDYKRKGEQEIVEMWLKLMPDFTLEAVENTRGAAVLRRGRRVPSAA